MKPKKNQQKSIDNDDINTPENNAENGGEESIVSKDIEKNTMKNETSAEELKDQMLRAMADAENTKRRAQREVEEAHKYGTTSIARDLIGVLENLYRAEDSVTDEDLQKSEILRNFYDGVELTRTDLLKVFEKHGIKRISPEGEKFDHNYHQALMHVESHDVEPGTVIQVMQAGYIIHDRLLRPAMVSVAKNPADKNNEDSKQENC